MPLQWMFVWFPPWLRPETDPVDSAAAAREESHPQFPPPSREQVLEWIKSPVELRSVSHSPESERSDSRERSRSRSPRGRGGTHGAAFSKVLVCTTVDPDTGAVEVFEFDRSPGHSEPEPCVSALNEEARVVGAGQGQEPLLSPTSPADWGPRGAGKFPGLGMRRIHRPSIADPSFCGVGNHWYFVVSRTYLDEKDISMSGDGLVLLSRDAVEIARRFHVKFTGELF